MSVEEIKSRAVVAVIRGASLDSIVPIGEALKAGGVTALEITVETPNALAIIEKASDVFGDEMLVGAGTVLDAETARAAIMAGSRFIFSPTVNIETIRMTKRYGVISVPGAFTATEILNAFENGADVIKVFPAGSVGPGYFKYIAGPLPQIPLMPTGGINLVNAKDYIYAGAVAVGVGTSLVDPKKTLTDAYLSEVKVNARKLMEEVQAARMLSASIS
ncbi:2-dehydro-3-deoxyphosphogluconate aldolase [Bacillus sp. AFS077874]|uniref:bifunctional 4-hydroxy-2-oxoglutarate aldolase/2-dehydro-3-deoxy-phosphogluconate aldolase n=1 Tax=unclassified Bacillus (in: firmicutes) TaxID=185979 RepID=UPI000BEBDFAD|nr:MULTISPECIES: bifunctional 4-hydroxy-2-oxoglutarate aldolase/2-dehydro-3-deoxy-phosphogluconate aldolase [unclassified Bacillus (in: firmicutes)]PEC50978.1 2-dehydro-3-deoxyphosphogluconate aldolase [Bacillus sp. AFS096315]PET76355.1 2-dehydro-3-deoxyphosphogluconate aldolase [Bacillus sp. AFS001701]PFM83230.1 2-dehydro-3-deoxyphosphogluconate aldolase [Bacillus sp. AFS077874]